MPRLAATTDTPPPKPEAGIRFGESVAIGVSLGRVVWLS